MRPYSDDNVASLNVRSFARWPYFDTCQNSSITSVSSSSSLRFGASTSMPFGKTGNTYDAKMRFRFCSFFYVRSIINKHVCFSESEATRVLKAGRTQYLFFSFWRCVINCWKTKKRQWGSKCTFAGGQQGKGPNKESQTTRTSRRHNSRDSKVVDMWRSLMQSRKSTYQEIKIHFSNFPSSSHLCKYQLRRGYTK